MQIAPVSLETLFSATPQIGTPTSSGADAFSRALQKQEVCSRNEGFKPEPLSHRTASRAIDSRPAAEPPKAKNNPSPASRPEQPDEDQSMASVRARGESAGAGKQEGTQERNAASPGTEKTADGPAEKMAAAEDGAAEDTETVVGEASLGVAQVPDATLPSMEAAAEVAVAGEDSADDSTPEDAVPMLQALSVPGEKAGEADKVPAAGPGLFPAAGASPKTADSKPELMSAVTASTAVADKPLSVSESVAEVVAGAPADGAVEMVGTQNVGKGENVLSAAESGMPAGSDLERSPAPEQMGRKDVAAAMRSVTNVSIKTDAVVAATAGSVEPATPVQAEAVVATPGVVPQTAPLVGDSQNEVAVGNVKLSASSNPVAESVGRPEAVVAAGQGALPPGVAKKSGAAKGESLGAVSEQRFAQLLNGKEELSQLPGLREAVARVAGNQEAETVSLESGPFEPEIPLPDGNKAGTGLPAGSQSEGAGGANTNSSGVSSPFSLAAMNQGASRGATAANAGPSTPATGLPIPAEKVIDQVVGKLTLNRNEKQSSISMNLHPEELGRVRLELTVEGDRVRAQIHAQSQQVQEILEKHLPKLREGFESQGLKLDEVRVSSDSPQQQGGNPNSYQEEQRRATPRFSGTHNVPDISTPQEEEPSGNSPPRHQGSINLRV
ncbi:MAG: flagellar hook-length control protein FliK [Desulfuromonadaceae bacterium]